MRSIAICSSVAFYKDTVSVAQKLRSSGFDVIIPKTAELMSETGDFNPKNYSNQLLENGRPKTKADFIREMFDELPKVDGLLVINNEKHGQPNYIGANVFLEIGVAFYFKKKLFLLNDIPNDSPFLDELKGMNPKALKGNLDLLQAELAP